MLTREMEEILSASRENGWVLEPEAKRLFSLAGMEVPRFRLATTMEEGLRFAREIGYPLAMKVVSPKVVHKSEKNGIELGIENERKLRGTFHRLGQIEGFCGVLVEEMIPGIELIVGAKVDFQFGPVILFGMGGVWVEVYRDVALRMAPLSPKDADSMLKCLKARSLLEGFRGKAAIDLEGLKKLLLSFSDLVMEMEGLVESIDLNPVICSPTRCVIADARIILKEPS